jgi:hypothetical protein
MRRPSVGLVLTGTMILAAACQGTGAASSAGAASAGTTSSAAPSGDEAAPAPALAWTFGNTAITDAGQVDLEFSGGNEFAGNAVTLDGRTGFGASVQSGPVDTISSFSVSAWVSLAEPVEYAAAVSQVGDEAAAFYLGIGESTWDFAMKDADTNEPGHTIRASSDIGLVDLDQWFNLVGVYDAENGETRLYVNGALGARTAFSQPWQAGGALTIGRAQAHFAPSDFWPGSIASVAIYADALTTGQVGDIYQATEPAGAPPQQASEASRFRGTWDHVLDDAGRDVILADFAGHVDSADVVTTRIGFDGNDWWQGFLFDGELFLLDGDTEGDGGSFTLAPDDNVLVMYGAGGKARIVYDYAIDGDTLTLRALEECDIAGPEPSCVDDPAAMDQVMLLVTSQAFTRSGDDPSYR